ncbi:ABC transporter permease [Rhodobacteraceae bacterium WD3A24]|nr:ABC transporter permease [Rhodobacteraceae bacterium WD3A24]
MTRHALLLATLALVMLGLFAASLLIGPAGLGVGESLAALFRGEGRAETLVMREIRLPRAGLAVFVGAALGLSGAALQGYLRNPLAEPGLIGVTGAAGLGAVVAIQTGLSAALALALPGMALIAAVLAVLLLLGLAGPRGGAFTLILAGIAISAFTSALTALVLNLSPNPFAATEMMFWLMGSLADRSMTHLALAAPFVVLGAAMLIPLGRGLDALTLGEDAAEALGIGLSRLRLMLVLGVAASVGAATAVTGAVGFVGLVVPHLLRPLTGAQPSRLLVASGLGGAAMVLMADIAVRLIAPERDLKLGVLTALVGAPFFLHLIWRTRREGV